MKVVLLVLVFTISTANLLSQNHMLTGRIEADSLTSYQITIVNITQETGTVTSKKGIFSLAVNLRDSIVFSSLIHEFKAQRVSKKDLKDTLRVRLKQQINQLPEVVLMPYDLSGDVLIDLPKIKVSHIDQTAYGFGTIRRLTPIQQEVYFVKTTGAVGILMMHLNGQMKQLKRRIAINKKMVKQLKIRPYLTEDLMRDQLDINPIYRDDFAYFCSKDPELISVIGQDKLKMIEMLIEKSVKYKASKYALEPND